MVPHRLTHTIRRIELICHGCWEVRTQTEDGRRFTAFGVTRQQAIYRAHHKAKAYGRYAYPTMPRAASRKPAPALTRRPAVPRLTSARRAG